jgi:hypothetical protein
MPWISPRGLKYERIAPRDIWWFRQELKKYQKITEEQALTTNTNANTWKWLHKHLIVLYEYRRRIGVPIKGTNPYPQTQTISRHPQHLNGFAAREHWKAWLEYVGKKFFNLDLVSIYTDEKIIPKAFARAAMTESNTLAWMWKTDWEYRRSIDEIQWCAFNRNWYFRNAFRDLATFDATGRRINIWMGGGKVFVCPVCTREYLDIEKNKKLNRFFGLKSCLSCADQTIENPPQTTSTIYGDYHSHYRTGKWKFFPCYTNNDTTIPLGVELEMQFKSQQLVSPPAIAWEMYQHQIAANPKWNYFYCERDGSIGEFGLEMVTQPMSQQLHNEFWKHMLPKIREHFTGWNTEKKHPGGQYGIHVTFDSKLFGQFNLARLVKFIENPKNGFLIQGIAQRGQLYGSNEVIAGKEKKLSDVMVMSHGKFLGSQNRAQPVNLKGEKGLCEIRMFRSTLNSISFMKNMEFLWAFHQWCGETPFNVKEKDFIAWLVNSPKLYYRYPNLYEYMSHTKFPTKLARWDTANPYHEIFSNLVFRQQKGQKDLFISTFTPDTTDYTT